jgi:hypothetical protein
MRDKLCLSLIFVFEKILFNIYIIKDGYPERQQGDEAVVQLFWSVENGMVGYQTKDNESSIIK